MNEHLASLTIPRHFTSKLFPSSIYKVKKSSSFFYELGLKVTETILDDPASTLSKAGSGTNDILGLTSHLYLASALPWLLMISSSVTLMSMFSSENSNFNTFLETSRITGSA
jgi:hypothetical protein